jgi:hypothetical protein
MKNAVITVRLPLAKRRRIETLARKEGRSLSQQVEQLIDRGLAGGDLERPVWSTAGILRGGPVPTAKDFRDVRRELSASLLRRVRRLERSLTDRRR